MHTPVDMEQRSLDSSSGSISKVSVSSRTQQRMSLSAMQGRQHHYSPAQPSTSHRRQTSNRPRKDSEIVASRDAVSKPTLEERHVPVRIVDDPVDELAAEGIPRPDSPISPILPAMSPAPKNKKKSQVRLSAVGGPYKPYLEAGWWDDDG